MRATAVLRCQAFLFAAVFAGNGAAAAEADLRILEPSESPANWTAPPFWVPPAETRSADSASTPAAASRTALTSNPPALPFFAVAPCRLADTRSVGGIIHASEVRSFQVTGACNIPAAAQAVSFNFTVTGPQGPGFLVAYAFNAPFPTVSILNFLAGQTLANGAIVALGAGQISAAMGVSAADLIIDVNGYYAPTGIVASVNNLTGDVSLAAGSNVTITPAGNTLTIAAPLMSLNASNVTSGVLGITYGGTGSTYAAGALTALGAATRGANTDITSLSNLTTPLSLTQGGTGSNTAVNARAALGAAARGANADITSLSTLTTPLSIAQGGTGTATPFASAFQARVTGTCAPGSFVLSVAVSGAVTCGTPAFGPRAGFTRTTVAPNAASGAAATVGADGLALIVYYDATALVVKAAHCVDDACTSVTTATLDAVPSMGTASITVGADGLGLIAYTPGGTTLKVAHCGDVGCSSATTATLATFTIGPGGGASVTIGTTGLGVISYVDGTALMTTACANAACTMGTTPVSLDGGNAVAGTSITAGADGNPLIAYTDIYNTAIRVAHCTTPTCTGATTYVVWNSGYASATTIALGADGYGVVAWVDNTANALKFVRCTDVPCSSSTILPLGALGIPGTGTAITLGADGLPLVVYTGARTGVAHCASAACTFASMAVLDTVSSTSPSVTIGADGLPLVVYVESVSKALKTVHCGSALCVPYFRRR